MSPALPPSVAARWLSLLVLLVACSGGTEEMRTDAGTADADAPVPPRYDIPWFPSPGHPLAVPACRAGWHEQALPEEPVTCAPYPADGPATCPAGQMHFAGGPGCEVVGSACPTDGVPADLPTDRPVVYVLSGSAGGDGTRGAPFGSLDEAGVASLPANTIAAIGRGTYDGAADLPAGVTLWGACVAQTMLVASEPNVSAGVVNVLGADAEVRNLTIGESPRQGVSIVGAGQSALLEGIWIEGVQGAGVSVRRGSVTARTVVIRGTGARSDETRATDGESGNSLYLAAGASGQVEKLVAEDNHEYGIYGRDEGTTLTLSDIVVRGTQPRALDGTRGRGITMDYGADLEVSGALVTGSTEIGIMADGSVLRLGDVVVTDTAASAGDFAGVGVHSQRGSQVELRRAVVERAEGVGIYTGEAETVLSDVVVRDTGDGIDLGYGLYLETGATLEAERLVVERNQQVGIFASQGGATALGGRVSLRDALIRQTILGEMGTNGMGIGVFDEITGDFSRTVVLDSPGYGIVMANGGTRVDMSDILVADTLVGRDGGAGMGLGGYTGAAVTVTRFEITDHPLCGVHVATAAEMDLSVGKVAGCAIGVCLQVDGYDVDRLANDVVYTDNETNLTATTLPVPEAPPGL